MIRHDQYEKLIRLLKKRYAGAKCGIFTNHTSFYRDKKKYLLNVISRIISLKFLFVPEHGFFAELQDQVPVSGRSHYDFLQVGSEICSLYPADEELPGKLRSLDLMIMDIQDAGTRYFTYVTMIARILQAARGTGISLIVIDRPNPSGRLVEGTLLQEEYASLIGWKGLPHRYGLTIGELTKFLYDQIGGDFDLSIITMTGDHNTADLIFPSPNMPHPLTPLVYPGQCLWEGTNVSEGRGTTRPFEIFGAPFFRELLTDWVDDWNEHHPEAILRPLVFMPVFHKFRMEYCYGFQLHPVSRNFTSLRYSLQLIKAVKEELEDFRWLEGPYESGSDRSAIELLAGDPELLDYLEENVPWSRVNEKLTEHERVWVERTSRYILYGDRLVLSK